mmetsp:Transcript_145230/g.266859  ORF Transcript_145230/g.266859 Transcript_145230/m.266859 type:complete len:486 (+) Transcript_145230:138-1595(+)
MSVRSKLSRQLSIIQEAHAGHERLVYVIIGPGARIIASFVAQSACSVFPNLAADPSFMADQRASSMSARRSGGSRKNRSGRNRGSQEAGPASSESFGASASDPFGNEEISCQFYVDGHREIAEKRGKVTKQNKAELEKKKAEEDAAKLAEEVSSNRDFDKQDSKQKTEKARSRISNMFHHGGGRQSAARQSTASRKSGSRFSLLSRASNRSDITEVPRQVIKTTYIPVEKFSEEVPPCPTAAHFKDVCILFLIDERQEAANNVLSDLTFRKAEVERWIQATLKKFDLAKLPPMLAAVLVHTQHRRASSKIACINVESGDENGQLDGCDSKSGPLIEVIPPMPGTCTTSLIKPSPSSGPFNLTVPAMEDDPTASARTSITCVSQDSGSGRQVLFSPPEDWKYNTFLEAIKSLVKVEDMAYTCDFDDPEALLECVCKLSAEILKRRQNEEGQEMLTSLADGLLQPADDACCRCCGNSECCRCRCVVS